MLFYDFRINCVSILAIILIICSVPFVSTEKESSNSKDDKFISYKKGKEVVRGQLAKFEESDLEKEAKLTSVKSPKGVISFYQHEKVDGKAMFSLDVSNSKSQNFPKNIVLGVKEISTKQKTSDHWMSSVFLALRQCSYSTSGNNDSVADYYAVIAYVSKDSIGTVLEWDQWTFTIMKNFAGKKRRFDEISSSLAKTSILCSYATCACLACVCEMNNKGTGPSSPTDAYARSLAHKRGGSVSQAITKNGTAVADSITENDGPSISYARGHTGAVSQADAGHGDAKAMSLTNSGFAQSSSQSRVGDVRAQAGRTGAATQDYDDEYYDVAADKSKESMEAETIFKDTNLVFEETKERSDQAKTKAMGKKQKLIVCSKEKDINASISRIKLETIMKGLKGSNRRKRESEPETKQSSKDKYLFHEVLLPVGIDVDSAINSSVILASNITGFTTALRCKKCDEANSNKKDVSKITLLLKFLKQECNADLTTQAERLKGFKTSGPVNLMEIQKLNSRQLEDIVPNVLINVYKSKSTQKSYQILTNFFKNSTSVEITEIAAIIINAVDYATTNGRLHKMKIMKGLSLNVQNVWTGLLLEFKRCHASTSCNVDHMQSISKDQNLVLGLYVFLKIADTFYSKAPEGINPADILIRFLKIHKSAIVRETECKAKRAAAVRKSETQQ